MTTPYSDAVLADSPVHFFPLYETGGASVENLGSAGTDGVNYGGNLNVEFEASVGGWQGDEVDDALVFVDEWSVFPGAVTLETWIDVENDTEHTVWAVDDHTGSTTNYHGGFYILASGGYYVEIRTGSSTIRFWERYDGYDWPAGKLHVVAVIDGSSLTIYVNGESIPSPVASDTYSDSTSTATQLGYLYQPGLRGSFAYFDYALTSTQVDNHYQAGLESASSGTGPFYIEHHTAVAGKSGDRDCTLATSPTVGHTLVSFIVVDKDSGTIEINTADGWEIVGTPYVSDNVSGAIAIKSAASGDASDTAEWNWATSSVGVGWIGQTNMQGATIAGFSYDNTGTSSASSVGTGETASVPAGSLAIAVVGSDTAGTTHGGDWSDGYSEVLDFVSGPDPGQGVAEKELAVSGTTETSYSTSGSDQMWAGVVVLQGIPTPDVPTDLAAVVQGDAIGVTWSSSESEFIVCRERWTGEGAST